MSAGLGGDPDRSACRGLGGVVSPDHTGELLGPDEEVVGAADHDGGRLHVDRQGVARSAVTTEAEATALADGHQLDGVDLTDRGALTVDEAGRAQRDATAQERRSPSAAVGDEAHVLAVGLVRGAQTELGGPSPHLLLGHPADGQEHPLEVAALEHVDHVALVLAGVAPPHDPPLAIGPDPLDAGVVAGGDGVEPEHLGPAQQAVELQVPVALDARVRGQPGGVIGHVGLDDVGGEVVAEVEDQVLDAEAVGHAAGVVDVAHRAAAGVGLSAPQLQRDAHDLVAVVGEQGRRHRRVHATGHGHQHLHGRRLT